MTSERVIELFRQRGALLEGHFLLSSGLHSSGYLQCALVLQHPPHAASLGAALAERAGPLAPVVVLSPALGGVVIGHEVARALNVRALFAERRDGRLTLGRGFQIAREERVLVVEDVVTTGSSTRETIAVAREAGGQVIGVVAIINRSGSDPGFDVPFAALAEVVRPAYKPNECPLCADGVPAAKPGSRPGAPGERTSFKANSL